MSIILGQLIYFFEMACAISGYILDVNPFDQPGVEAYKKNMFALLNKPGFEEAGKKLRRKIIEKTTLICSPTVICTPILSEPW